VARAAGGPLRQFGDPMDLGAEEVPEDS